MNNLIKELNTRAIRTFKPELVEIHKSLEHEIYQIPAGYTIIDAIYYILNYNHAHIADFISKYQFELPEALEIAASIEKGLKSRTLCLTCMRNQIQFYMTHN